MDSLLYDGSDRSAKRTRFNGMSIQVDVAHWPEGEAEHVRLHVGNWGDERNCYKWDQSVAVDPEQS